MWCSSCQQDVPGVASLEDTTKICCARCSRTLSSSSSANHSPSCVDPPRRDETELSDGKGGEQEDEDASSINDNKLPVDLDDWEFEEDLQAVERIMRSLRNAGILDTETKEKEKKTHAFDSPHSAVPGWHVRSSSENEAADSKPRAAVPKRRRPLVGFLAWTMLSIGLMTFVCGAVLLGWSFAEGRASLWTLGLPLALGGQAVILVGLLFQLESLWESNRDTTSTLGDLDEQLHDLRHVTSLLSTTRSGHAQSFYAHMAEGASPNMLLADLKGQLDMLSTKISNQKR